jgi:hypothetical protein
MRNRRRLDGIGNPNRRAPMLDIVFVTAVLAFFAAGALFVRACERI